ncbi:hypothetical protein, partial [Burkholderia cepacia]|uniref:hypothetical protein n=1 Tax=Burkholderia cepacia TaxID=292 RepID=UPI000AD7B338
MSDAEDLKQLVRTNYPSGSTVLGSQLGALVAEHFPRLLNEHRKLGALISSELSDTLVFRRKGGRDNVYEVISGVGVEAYSEADAKLWNVFCNPRKAGAIYIRHADKMLVSLPVGSNAPHGLTELPRLSDADVHEIIAEFCAKEISAKASVASAPIELNEHYWRNWNAYLREFARSDNAIIANWRSFHAQAIEQRFANRLDTLGLPPKDIERWTLALVSSRTKLSQIEGGAPGGA